jgi:D-glycero-alpha-D-manno-heptose-7-phosphate kinase
MVPAPWSRPRSTSTCTSSIDKYVHVLVAPRFEGDLRIGYSRTEICDSVDEVEHDLVREALRRTELSGGLDILTLADVPGGGTGMGSSSAVTVGLLNAPHAYRGTHRSAEQHAREACDIEIDTLGSPIGYQDQFAVAVGRMNLIEFDPGVVRVQPIVASSETFARLHHSLMLFYLGGARSADAVLANQNNGIRNGSNVDALAAIRDLAYRTRDLLGAGDVDGAGELLHEGWELKRTLADGISNNGIDNAYGRARKAGALGGKLLGAGGSGFLLVYAPARAQDGVRGALTEYREIPFHFSSVGTQIRLVDQW